MAGIIRSTVREIDEVTKDFVAFLGRNGADESTISRFKSSAGAAKEAAGPHGEIISRPAARTSSTRGTSWRKKVPTSPV